MKAKDLEKNERPMADLRMLHDSSMPVRRALVLWLVKHGVNTNKALVERLGLSTPLVSQDVARLRDDGYLQPSPGRGGPKEKPMRLTSKGSRYANSITGVN
jgi:Mn-dependent DtxR family transcriptional regulator